MFYCIIFIDLINQQGRVCQKMLDPCRAVSRKKKRKSVLSPSVRNFILIMCR